MVRSTGYQTAIKWELVRLDCKKSIIFPTLLPSERSNCVDHTKQRQTARLQECDGKKREPTEAERG